MKRQIKIQRQIEYHHTLKGRKTLSSAVPGTRTWDLSFMKRVCYQLSYPIFDLFNTVQHTLSHTVERRKLDSLATPDNIV